MLLQDQDDQARKGAVGETDCAPGTALRDLGENELVFDIGTRLDLTGILTLLFAAGRSFRGEESGEPQFFTYVGLQFLFE